MSFIQEDKAQFESIHCFGCHLDVICVVHIYLLSLPLTMSFCWLVFVVVCVVSLSFGGPNIDTGLILFNRVVGCV